MNNEVMNGMIEYFGNDVKRIYHFLKVYSLGSFIGKEEKLEEPLQHILEVACLTHDIGIKISEIKYQSASGTYQQLEGPNEAKILLEKIQMPSAVIDRVCWLIAHHHTYHDITGMDYQILVEADFLVNMQEDQMSKEAIKQVKETIFKTKTGIRLLETMFLL